MILNDVLIFNNDEVKDVFFKRIIFTRHILLIKMTMITQGYYYFFSIKWENSKFNH